ncbi:MAG: NAD(P)H-binding protein, partial [Pseudomonadota bacterium]
MSDDPDASAPMSGDAAAAPLRLAILGASRGIGALTVACALSRGHSVTALARDPSELPGPEGRLTRVAGDAREAAALDRALTGADAVLYALGTPGSARGPFGGAVTLHSQATAVLIERMQAAGLGRLIAVTGYGAGDSRAAMSRPEQMAHRLFLGRPY